jgi:hypothetical protein
MAFNRDGITVGRQNQDFFHRFKFFFGFFCEFCQPRLYRRFVQGGVSVIGISTSCCQGKQYFYGKYSIKTEPLFEIAGEKKVVDSGPGAGVC